MQREVKIILRTIFEDGSGLSDQDWYDDKLTMSYGTIEYADEDWHEGKVQVGKEKITIKIIGVNIPNDCDGSPIDHMEIKVYEMNFDESDLNFHSEDVNLVNGNFKGYYYNYSSSSCY